MDITLSTCFVLVTDPDAALEFYRDVVGLDVRNDVANGEFRWITVSAPVQDGVDIVLTNYVAGSPSDLEAVAAIIAKGGLSGVHFATDDLDGVFARMRDAGAEVVEEPTQQPWGARDFAVRDPSGNMVRVNQR